jgi:hypothetical protein
MIYYKVALNAYLRGISLRHDFNNIERWYLTFEAFFTVIELKYSWEIYEPVC